MSCSLLSYESLIAPLPPRLPPMALYLVIPQTESSESLLPLPSPAPMSPVNYTTSCILVWNPLIIPSSCLGGDPLTLSSGQCGELLTHLPSQSLSPLFLDMVPRVSTLKHRKYSLSFLIRAEKTELCDKNVIVKHKYIST